MEDDDLSGGPAWTLERLGTSDWKRFRAAYLRPSPRIILKLWKLASLHLCVPSHRSSRGRYYTLTRLTFCSANACSPFLEQNCFVLLRIAVHCFAGCSSGPSAGAMRDSPDAFAATLETEESHPAEKWLERIQQGSSLPFHTPEAISLPRSPICEAWFSPVALLDAILALFGPCRDKAGLVHELHHRSSSTLRFQVVSTKPLSLRALDFSCMAWGLRVWHFTKIGIPWHPMASLIRCRDSGLVGCPSESAPRDWRSTVSTSACSGMWRGPWLR